MHNSCCCTYQSFSRINTQWDFVISCTFEPKKIHYHRADQRIWRLPIANCWWIQLCKTLRASYSSQSTKCMKEMTNKKYSGWNIVLQVISINWNWFRESACMGFQESHTGINCFIELRGNHQFSNDPQYGEVCKRFRNGEPTGANFEYTNQWVLSVQQPDGSWTNPGDQKLLMCHWIQHMQSWQTGTTAPSIKMLPFCKATARDSFKRQSD
jgi:hypothetical protein